MWCASATSASALAWPQREFPGLAMIEIHATAKVSALCDTIVVIARGKIVGAGSSDDLRRQTGQDNLEDAFVSLSGLEAEGQPS